jgi:uncharacterized protein with GYD domain
LPGRGIGAEVPHERRATWLSGVLEAVLAPKRKETPMPTYITLSNFTHQGIVNVKDTTKRAEAFKNIAKQLGCTVKEIYWTQGQYDAVTILDAPDDATAIALAMSVGRLGNIRTNTLRAFTAAELAPILDKVV